MKQHNPIWPFLTLAAFLLLICPDMVRKTMYNDGLWYATIARNLAEGRGSFWEPMLTETIFSTFHEHPPLVFGLQAIFFYILGDSIAVEKTYALFVFLVSVLIMVLIWRKHQSDRINDANRAMWFLPVMLWIINEVVFVYYAANILECTMGAFTLGAVYALMHVDLNRRLKYNFLALFLGAAAVVGAVLSKGPPGLFPLAFFVIYSLAYRDSPLRKAFLYTTVLATLVVLISLPLVFWESAWEGLSKYWETQVMASIQGIRTEHHFRESRWYIVQRLLEIHLPALLLVVVLLLVFRKRGKDPKTIYHFKDSLFFLGIGLAASLPLMISSKQAYYYLLPSLPFFAIAFSIPAIPAIKRCMEYLRPAGKANKFAAVVVILLLFLGVGRTVLNYGGMSYRDSEVLHDVELFGEIIPIYSKVGTKIYTPNTIGYLYRRYHISLDTSIQGQLRPYWISEKGYTGSTPSGNFVLIDLPTVKYDLHQSSQ